MMEKTDQVKHNKWNVINNNKFLKVLLITGLLSLAVSFPAWAGNVSLHGGNVLNNGVAAAVKDAVYYWACGLLYFLLGGGAVWMIANTDNIFRIDNRRKGGRKVG